MISVAPLRYQKKCRSLFPPSQVYIVWNERVTADHLVLLVLKLLGIPVTVLPRPLFGVRTSPILVVMHFLLLDTAAARGCFAIFRDQALLTGDPYPAIEDFSSWLLPAVERSLTRVGLSHADLDGYAVCTGPGSFTGLRV